MTLSLNSYGSCETKITIDESFQSKCHFLEEAFMNALMTDLAVVTDTTPNEEYPNIRRHTIDSECGYMVFGWTNQDPSYQYIEESEFKVLKGAKFLAPYLWSPVSGGMGF